MPWGTSVLWDSLGAGPSALAGVATASMALPLPLLWLALAAASDRADDACCCAAARAPTDERPARCARAYLVAGRVGAPTP